MCDAAIAKRHGQHAVPCGAVHRPSLMNLDPISLRLFVAVMEENAIARAAAATPSGVSISTTTAPPAGTNSSISRILASK